MKVYFGTPEKIAELIDFENCLVKVHFGEEGNSRYIKPDSIKPLLKNLNNYFFTDTHTLYAGSRVDNKSHEKVAKKHGFGIFPLKFSNEEKEITIKGNIFSKIRIGKLIAEAENILMISHFKGHGMFGFGGAIKNLGMGCGSRHGKMEMHSKISPFVNDDCTACGICKENCLWDAIEIKDKAIIDKKKCTGCAKCIAVCPEKAVKVPWGGNSNKEVMERCVEYALFSKNKNLFYVNFVVDITKDCDCLKDSEIIGKDVGVLASKDPVALDKACYDLVKKEQGDIFLKENNVDGTHILDYAEKIGLGKKDYNLLYL